MQDTFRLFNANTLLAVEKL